MMSLPRKDQVSTNVSQRLISVIGLLGLLKASPGQKNVLVAEVEVADERKKYCGALSEIELGSTILLWSIKPESD